MGKFDKPRGKFGGKHQKRQYHERQHRHFETASSKDSNKPWNSEQVIPKVSLREDQVGITEYVNSETQGFTAVIKSRYSDFHVNEIDLENKVLVLNDLEIPKAKGEPTPTIAAETINDMRETFKEIITEHDWLKIDQLAGLPKTDAASLEPIEININGLDKAKRTEFHNLFKALYTGKLVSTTITKDDIRYVRVSIAKGSRDEKREKWAFPGEYVKFLVHKENMDTTAVASHIARHLSLPPSKVNYCGTKDKRAITTQMFSVKRRKPSDILASVRSLRNVRLGNFSFADEVLKLGQLRGNRFRIALRHISAAEDDVERAVKQLQMFGFINYFGMQRFGNCVDVPTYEVGVALMKADYKAACELILKPRDGDLPFLKAIRETWWKNRNAKEASDMFRSERFIEKKLLDGLVKHGENDYATALRKLPRNLLLLYPHAFQSLVFNKIASRRIKKYGLQLIPGDLVYCTPQDENENETLQADMPVEAMVELADDVNNPEDNAENIENEQKINLRQKVRTLTSEDVASDNYSIYDVVLPLPGFEVAYPNNELNDWYIETMQEYGLTSESMNHNVKTFKLSGAYRKLIVLPGELRWELCCYDKCDAQLIPSDWDQLKGIECKNRYPIEKYLSDSGGLSRALTLEFSLPPACYATMLLRELLKADTSSANQSSVEIQAKSSKQDISDSSAVESNENVELDLVNKAVTYSKNCENQQKRVKNADNDFDESTLSKKLCTNHV